MGVVLGYVEEEIQLASDANDTKAEEEPTKKIIGIITIEGNSADVVAIREYDLSDSRILGYGDPWAAKDHPPTNTTDPS